MNKEEVIKELQLESHVEGGYFIRTYTSPITASLAGQLTDGGQTQKERAVMSSIFYMLTDDSPINHFNRNSSNIVHYFHLGLPIKYYVISPDGQCSTVVLGPNILAGHKLQFMVAGGCWKAAELMMTGDSGGSSPNYGLTSEAVAPEFNYADWSLGTEKDIQKVLPQNWEVYKRFIKPT